MQYTDLVIDAICQEIILRKTELPEQVFTSLYLGGGSPSVLNEKQLDKLFRNIYAHYKFTADAEVTIEVNPDDIVNSKITLLKSLGVNRVSIGVQSFDETTLKWMNRSHSAIQAKNCILDFAKAGFEQISIDLIYGLPMLSIDEWLSTIQHACSFPITHISSYCLTVETKTKLNHLVNKNMVDLPSDDSALEQFELLISTLSHNGFEQYEISNFSKNGNYAKHNTSYWMNEPYIGIGPSAHSFQLHSRRWNISNNQQYVKLIQSNKHFWEEELLSKKDLYNESIMTGLRTKWGCDTNKFDSDQKSFLLNQQPEVEKLLSEQLIVIQDGIIKLTQAGKFLADGIAARLFV
jgi:oxygen-independent coproporphyrinogen-3 oxidase